jgi:hypothetical protein
MSRSYKVLFVTNIYSDSLKDVLLECLLSNESARVGNHAKCMDQLKRLCRADSAFGQDGVVYVTVGVLKATVEMVADREQLESLEKKLLGQSDPSV